MSCNDKNCAPTNLTLRQATLFNSMLTITDEGAPIDLTGYQFSAVGKLQYDSGVAFTFSFEIQDQITQRGKVRWFMPADQTAPLQITEDTIYIYDVLMTQPDTEPICIVYGQILIQPVITP